ncbi:MAG: UDP-N-acetylglucosamine 2-epimerase [Myxococcota bacterium]
MSPEGSRRRVAVFTGSRAEYGLLVPVLRAIAAHPGLELRLVVGGSHLDARFGATRDEIARDGFAIHAEAPAAPEDDGLAATAGAVGRGVLSVAEALGALEPDLFLVYGDRFEAFAALVAATQMGIGTAHLEGGDLTEGGALDDSLRHAMTKLAHLHFATNADAAWRLGALGEEPWRIASVGLPALDLIAAGEHATPAEVARSCELDPDEPLVLFTQHSVATAAADAVPQLRSSLEALDRLLAEGVQVLATHPNQDAGGQAMAALLEAWASERPGARVVRSLGRARYHGALALCAEGRGVCAGNSSSGLKETPVFGCPAVDVGARQAGRLRGENVLHVPHDAAAIEAALRRALFDDAFRGRCREAPNPYGDGGAGGRIAEALATAPLGAKLLQKRMTLRRA